ncbi:MAG: DUF1080 domain-containing protein [Acidobacteria bacterium]|nr:DUF1080 domain-containing protein [Acidobacteriota bacterium]
MRLSLKPVIAALVLSGLSLSHAPLTARQAVTTLKAGQWTPLFNGKDLTGWDVYLGPKMDAKGQKMPGTATGLNKDPDHVFSVAQVDGGPVIRISGVIGGGVSTVNSYENYHLRLQMKWGTGNPWNRAVADSGVLYHAGGEHGLDGDFWMRSFEYQVMPGLTADLITILGCVADVPSSPSADGKVFVYDPKGQRRTFSREKAVPNSGGRVARLPSFKNPETDWITLEIYTVGQTAVHLVNGQVVLAVYNTRLYENGATRPLMSGKIQIQSEGSEVFYRNIEVTPITAIPAGLVERSPS